VTVKDRVGRQRYIAFRVESRRTPSQTDLADALRAAAAALPAESRPRLVLWRDGQGLVRCPHTAKEPTIALVRGITAVGGQAVTVQTLGTSGTIRRARRKYLEPEPRETSE